MLPDVSVTIQDGAQGLTPDLSDQVHAILAFCSKGDPSKVYSFNDIKALRATMGDGIGVECAAYSLSVAGGPVYMVPINEARLALNGSSGFTAGTCGSVTQSGSGPALTVPALSAVTASGTTPPAVTLTGTPLTFVDLKVVILTTGSRGTATFKYSTDGGLTYSATQTTAATFEVPSTGITLNFALGTYTNDNVYVAQSCTPFDSFEVRVEILSAGALGTSTFRFALDALNPSGPTWSATLVTPTGGTYVIPNTGITLTFASGSYVVGTTYSFTCSPPAYNSTDVTDVMNVLLADPREWGCVHLVGQASTIAGSFTMASVLDSLMTTAETARRYAFAIVELADDTDANIIAAKGTFASLRVSPAGGFERLTSAISGRQMKRSVAWGEAARVSKVSIGTDLGQVSDGPVPGVSYLHRDEQVTPGLDAIGVTTMRTIVGRSGAYITNGRIAAPAGSDFQLVQFRRVMDRACKVARDALLSFLNAKVRLNANGTIFELDARAIEAAVGAKLNAALTQPGEASAVACVVDRTNNVQTTNALNVEVRVRPLGYAKTINLTIGFSNPSLAVK